MSEFTQLLLELQDGKACAKDRLVELVYSELRRMAAAKMASERPGHTLDATGLVHEAFLKLSPDQAFESRRHFFGSASEAMRRILIDRARARSAEKRGGNMERLEVDPDQIGGEDETEDRLVELDVALEKLEQSAPQKAELVKLRYFTGLTILEAAEILGISTATADRYWAFAKSWLQAEVHRQKEPY